MIDLHCHLLPGVDDGPSTTAVSLEMARMAWDSGTRTIVATPHMIGRYPTTPAQVVAGIARLRPELDRAGIPIEVRPGGEIALDFLPRMRDDDLRAATLGGGGRWLLLEMPFRGWPLHLPELLRDLEMRGLGAVIAHPERAEAVQRAPYRMHEIVGLGALVQITTSSLTGENGTLARRTAATLLRDGVAHFIASDAHSSGWRAPVLGEGLEAAARVLRATPDDLAWMVDEGPRLVIQGRPVRPPRLGPTRTPRADAPQARAGTPRSPRR
jgi:protein-tyrosine phosphatase